MVGLLGAGGWLERPSDVAVVRQYSRPRTLYHPQWNCDIDVPDRFPGMEAAPGSAFDTLWDGRQYLVMAARSVPVPSLPEAVIFQALHSLRAMDDPCHQRECSGLLQEVDASMHPDILDLSAATAARGPRLDDLGVKYLPCGEGRISEEWRYRTSVQGTGAAYLVELMDSPWLAKPRVLARAIFPSWQSLRHDDLYLDESVSGIFRAYISRWGRGLASLPAAARRIRASRRR